MSEHAWVLENAAAHCAGGLKADEVERLDKHTAKCQACADLVAEFRGFDQLFEVGTLMFGRLADHPRNMRPNVEARSRRRGSFFCHAAGEERTPTPSVPLRHGEDSPGPICNEEGHAECV